MVCFQEATMTTVMEEDRVSSLADVDHVFQGRNHFLLRGLDAITIIGKYGNVFRWESLFLDEVVTHVVDIIVAASELAILTTVVDADQNGSFLTFFAAVEGKGLFVNVQRSTASHLWNLRHAFVLQFVAQGHEGILKGERFAFVLVQEAQ